VDSVGMFILAMYVSDCARHANVITRCTPS
jgi:hypothetical protein